MEKSRKVRDLLNDAECQLQSLSSARLDAEVLLAYVINSGRESLYAHPDKQVPATLCADYQSLVSKRADSFPVAYLTGNKEFWSSGLFVNCSTLIPRPETETLVESALGLIRHNAVMNILDLGTGSGAIAIAIAKERPLCHVTASDISSEALSIARTNACRHQVTDIGFIQSDWFSSLKGKVFDLILCNPPYVDSSDDGFLLGEIRFEPRIALDGGHFGMQSMNQIIPGALQHLQHEGYLLIEHGFEQGESVRCLFSANKFIGVTTIKDYAGLERVTLARCP
ncbi:MAG: peptide chain release factor N(5)-glutamine methyltransferase [Gammaproteobacteria bacterium]